MIHPDNGEANIADEVERPREVPIIVRSGDVHVLKGEGMPKLARGNSRGGGYGDLYVQYKVEMPMVEDVYRVLSGESSASRAFRSLLRVEAGAESEPG